MAQMTSGTQQAHNVAGSFTSYKSIARHHGPGKPNPKVKASDYPCTTTTKVTTRLPNCREYKPTVLKWWYHGLLIICLAAFLGLTEYAIRTLLVNNSQNLVPQLQTRSIEEHHGEQKSVPAQQESWYGHLAMSPSNTTSNQAGASSLNTGDLSAPEYQFSTLTGSMDSISPGPTSSHTPPPTGVQVIYWDPHKSSFVPETSESFPVTVTSSSGHLIIGTTTSTLTSLTPDTETSSLSTRESTIPTTTSPPHIVTLTVIGTLSSSDLGSATGGYLSLGMTTATMVGGIEPASPSATTSKVAGVISEDGLNPDEEPIITIAEQTESWAASETAFEMSSTESEGRVAAQRIRTTLLGATPGYQPTQTLPPTVHGESVTVIRQTEMWLPSKATFERTTSDSRGYIFFVTVTTDLPAKTDVIETKVTMQPGEILVAVPKIVATIHGGHTQVMQTTFVDSEGRTTMSSYTTVVGGRSVTATHTCFLATSLPSGYTVLTIPTAVSTTEQEMVKVVQTLYTDAQGHVTTTSYTTRLSGRPTMRTIPIVIATPTSPVDELVPLHTVIPTTIGGKTKIIKLTSTDSRGQPMTSSYTTVQGGTPTSTTVWTSFPTPTSTVPTNSNGTQDTEDVIVVVYGLGLKEYILGAFLPTILAAIIAYPFKLININARLMQPFHELAAARGVAGVSAEASIFLRFYAWTGALSLARSAKLRQPVIIISDLLTFGAALLAPIAAETVSIHVPGGCDLGCYGTLGVTKIPGRILEALIATMMVLLIALIFSLNFFLWETGVNHNPWGIAGMASLGLSPGFRDRILKIPCDSSGSIKENMILMALTQNKFGLDEFWISSSPESAGVRGYGLVVKTSNGEANKVKINRRGNRKARGQKDEKKADTQPFALLTWWGRCILLFIFACVLIIATYYETTSLDSGFERFMDSRGFGIRFFFTALGVVVGGCMETFFRSVAIILPYQLLSKHALPAGRSILLSPPTNAFYGILSAFRQRSIFLGAVSFATMLAELFLPVTLSHVPFSHLDTSETQFVCTWLSISILAFMILVILYSFCIRWPHMPVDPRTIAGAMFYVCDSWMLGAMDGMATLEKKDRDSIVNSQRLKYEFACSEGVSGKERMKVDVCRDTGEASVVI